MSRKEQDTNQIRIVEKLSIAIVLSRLIPESVQRWQFQGVQMLRKFSVYYLLP